MTCLVTVKKVDGVNKVVQVEALQYTPEADASKGQYLFTTENESSLNALLNNYDQAVVNITSEGVLNLTLTDVPEDPSGRVVEDADWLKRTRPALMRAATTTHLFNA